MGLPVTEQGGGYRYSLDPFLLADFAAVESGTRIADLGTGSGIVALLLARQNLERRLVGIEIQARLAAAARNWVRQSELEERVEILHADLRECRKLLNAESFAAVVSNPPYRKPGHGRIAPDPERAAGRHELHGGLGDFIEAARYLLHQGGRCYLIYLPERLTELLLLLRGARLEPKRLRCVHGRAGGPATMVLLEARRNGRPGLTIEEPLQIMEGENYSAEAEALLSRWRLLLPDAEKEPEG